jgi:hypothetical protein
MNYQASNLLPLIISLFFLSMLLTSTNLCLEGAVGHAWIYLQGKVNGQSVFIEGGHSGELGVVQPKYFHGIMNLIDQRQKDPVKYLWEIQRDGFFQRGSGNHPPTFAAKFDISEEEFKRILNFIQPDRYVYENYSLTGKQCCSFVAEIASLIGCQLDFCIKIPIARSVKFRGSRLTLWHSPNYSNITIGSPDILEKSLIEAVRSRKAEYALDWYFRKCCHLCP